MPVLKTGKFVERYINGKPTKTRKKFSDRYLFVDIPYEVKTLKKLQALNFYFKIVDILIFNEDNFKIQLRIYKPASYLLVAFLYNFFKQNHIDNFKISYCYGGTSKMVIIDSKTIEKELAKGYIR